MLVLLFFPVFCFKCRQERQIDRATMRLRFKYAYAEEQTGRFIDKTHLFPRKDISTTSIFQLCSFREQTTSDTGRTLRRCLTYRRVFRKYCVFFPVHSNPSLSEHGGLFFERPISSKFLAMKNSLVFFSKHPVYASKTDENASHGAHFCPTICEVV